MQTFLRFFYEFISIFFDGIFSILRAIYEGTLSMFDFSKYMKIINTYKSELNGFEYVLFLVSIGVVVIAFILIGVLLFFLIRRIIRIKKNKVNQEDLIDEISNLNTQVKSLMEEKNKIMAMKVSQLGLKPGEEPEEQVGEEKPKEEGEESEDDIENITSRFPKLTLIDREYMNYKVKKYDTTMNLEELVENFKCFAASKLKLYYDDYLLRAFISGLGCGKLMILQGISGTGKTSLAYAWGKFVNMDSCVASVEPAWRNKTELIGYFNEFTKKFNESEVLKELYKAGYDDEVHTIILDEMNIARVEYYFAEMLSIYEMPSSSEWIIELVPNSWPDDPKRIKNGKLKLPKNLWYIGTINNDDSTFMVTDKVYDRAMPIDINTKVNPFKCRDQDAISINCSYLEALFEDAIKDNEMSPKSLERVLEMDDYIIKHFRISFGNRIMKQLHMFVSIYVACGGKEVQAIDYFIARKIFRKFDQLNTLLIKDELDPFINYLNKNFGKEVMKECIYYLETMKKLV